MLMTSNQKDKTYGEKDTNLIQDEGGLVGMIRPEMVDMARRFMMMPKIRQTPLIQQRRFLLEKGLREDEINEAMKGLPLQHSVWNINKMEMESVPHLSVRSSSISVFLELVKYVMIITGFTYASWRLLYKYVLPRFFKIPEPRSVEQRICMIEEKVDDLQEMTQNATAQLLLKFQTLIDKQNTDRISFQSGADLSELNDIKKSIENISAMLVSKEIIPPIRTLDRKCAGTASSMSLQSEDRNRFGNSDNERLGEASALSEVSAAKEKSDGCTREEKSDPDSHS